MNEIHIHPGKDGWLATHYGPRALEIYDLFGTVTILTAWRLGTPAREVLQNLAMHNPGSIVREVVS